MAMKHFFSFRNLFFLLALGLLGYLVLRVDRIEDMVATNVKRQKFSLALIKNSSPSNPEWDISHKPELVNYVNILTQQPFYWLGKGLQCCAFLSQDGEYVLKFFYQNRLQEKSFTEEPVKYLFSKKFRNKTGSASKEREEVFSSSKLSFEEFAEESGIIYVHLNPTVGILKGIRVFDDKNQQHRVKPDVTSFIIQKKADYVAPTIVNLMNNGKVEEAKKRLNQIIDLLLTMTKKGFIDADNALIRNNNIGFTKTRAIYIDTGRITKESNVDVYKRMQYEFDTRLVPLEDWLKIGYPDLATFWQQRKQAVLASLNPDQACHQPVAEMSLATD